MTGLLRVKTLLWTSGTRLRSRVSVRAARSLRLLGVRAMLSYLVSIHFVLVAPALGQSLWEVTPYRIHLWVAVQTDARLGNWRESIGEDLRRRAESRLGALWQFAAPSVTCPLESDVLQLRTLTFDEVVAADAAVRSVDKLFVCVIRVDASGYHVRVQQLDVASRSWSTATDRWVERSSDLPRQLFELMCQHFSPLVRIERVEGDHVLASLQAKGLQRPESSLRRWETPATIKDGDVFRPFTRKADRNGVVLANGVEWVDWTVMTAAGIQSQWLKFNLVSGYRQPFRSRRSARVDQMAVRSQATLAATTLRLVDRQSPQQPLVGYEVYEQTNEGSSENATYLGDTDWRGELFIERNERLVRVFYVRSGQQLLGKLPLIVGQESHAMAQLRQDNTRLEAEGFLVGVQDNLIDLVARREVMAGRIRKYLSNRQADKAAELLKELRRLDTQDDFARRVQQRKQSLSSGDAQIQQKIDGLFAQTRTLLSKYLSQEQVDQLAAELAKLQTQGAAPAAVIESDEASE